MKIINRLNLGSASLFFLAVLCFSFFVWIFRIRDSLLKCFAAIGPASKSDNWRKLGSPFSGDFISLSRVGTVSKILSSSTSLSSDEFYSACCFIYSFYRPDNWGKLGVLSIAIESHRVIFSSSYANFDSLFLLALQLKTFTVAYILFVFDWSSPRDSRLYFLSCSSFRVHTSPGRCKWHHPILLLLLSIISYAHLLHSPFHDPGFNPIKRESVSSVARSTITCLLSLVHLHTPLSIHQPCCCLSSLVAFIVLRDYVSTSLPVGELDVIPCSQICTKAVCESPPERMLVNVSSLSAI